MITFVSSPTELECENPVESALLLTLAGIKTIMANQWSSTLAENSDKFQNMIKGFNII